MANYYVNPSTGNNSNDGSIGSPWATVNYALGTSSPIAAGDTLYLRGGNYNERITPKKSGTSGNPITVLAYEDETPNLRGASGQENILVLSGVSYLTFGEGLYFSYAHSAPGGNRRFPWIQIVSNASNPTSNIILEDFTIERPGWENIETLTASNWNEWGVMLDRANDCIIQRLTIRGTAQGIQLKDECMRATVRNCDIGHTRQSCITLTNSNGVDRAAVIMQNLLHNSAIEDGIQFMQDFSAGDPSTDESNRGTVIAYNIFYNNSENAIDLKGARNIVIHGNVIRGTIGSNDGGLAGWNRQAMGGITRGSSTSTSRVIIRHNIIYDNSGGTRLHSHWKVYNNTFVYNNRDYTGPGSTFEGTIPEFTGVRAQSSAPGMGIRNNIFVGHNRSDVSYRAGANQPNNEVDTDYNLYGSAKWRDTTSGNPGVLYTTLASWRTRLASNNWRYGKDANSIAVVNHAAIQFKNVPANPTAAHTSYDFGIQPTSPAKGKGGFLTKTVGTGSSTTWITVEDVTWFSNIFDRTDVLYRDFILVGTTSVGRSVLEIDEANSRIRVDSAVTYSAGTNIYYVAPGQIASITPDIGSGAFITFDSAGPPAGDPDEPGDPPPPPDPPPPDAGTAGGRAVVRVACNTSTGNQTIAMPSGQLGRNPKAWRFTLTRATTDDTAADHSLFIRGWATWDGETVTQGAIGIRSQHNVSTTSSGRRTIEDGCIFMMNGNNNNIIAQASFVSGDTTEAVINWTVAPSAAWLLTVEAFDAEDVYFGKFTIAESVDAYTTVTPGFEANYVEVVTVNGSIPNSQANNRWSHGFATRDEIGNITQQCFLYQAVNGVGTTALGAHLRSDYIGGEPHDGGAVAKAIQLSNWGSSSFRVNTKVATYSAGVEAFVLALRFDLAAYSGVVAMPTSASEVDYEHTVGFEPAQADIIATALQGTNAADNTGRAGGFAVGAWDGTRQFSNAVADRDNVGTSVTQSHSDDRFINLDQHDGTAGIVGHVTGAGATLLPVNYSAALSPSRYAILVAVQKPVVGQLDADLSADVTEGVAPLTVQFTDESTAHDTTITDWDWDFGDGNGSTEEDPEHTYTDPGVYEVSLTITDGTISSTAILQTPITVLEPDPEPPPPPPTTGVKVLASADVPRQPESDVVASAAVGA